MNALLDLEDAQAKLLALAPTMPTEHLDPLDALGRYLAQPCKAARTQPPADLSAMDGYAICGDGPWTLVGESRAGAPYAGALKPGQCARISTGAHMPDGAVSVLIQENAVIEGNQVMASDTPPAGRHVRKEGFDFSEGDTVLETGSHIGPAQVAAALAAGHSTVAVHAVPRVAIIDSGDELATDPSRCGPDQIPASNGAMIAGMLKPLGCETLRLGPVPDDPDALARALAEAESTDIVVTSGGASVGDHDLVQQALVDWGADLAFWKVAIKPGKPLMVATRGSQVIVGLPGNPVSSFVTCFLFVLPLVRAAMGSDTPLPLLHRLIAGESFAEGGNRREFLRGVSDGVEVSRAASQDSSALLALANANCLIDRPVKADPVKVGYTVSVYNLQNG